MTTHEATNESPELSGEKSTIDDSLLMSVSWVCRHYQCETSDNALVAGLPKGRFLTSAQALTALQKCRFFNRPC